MQSGMEGLIHRFGFLLGAQHPAYDALGKRLPTMRSIRMPGICVCQTCRGFLNHIKPALEKRLAESIAAGHIREIKISFYRDGLRMVIEKGKTHRPSKPGSLRRKTMA